MRLFYAGVLPSIEDETRYAAPPDDRDEDHIELTPFEEGQEAHEYYHGIETNPYGYERHPDYHDEWVRGWYSEGVTI